MMPPPGLQPVRVNVVNNEWNIERGVVVYGLGLGLLHTARYKKLGINDGCDQPHHKITDFIRKNAP